MSPAVPPLPFFCMNVLARFPDQLYHIHHRRIPASPALLDALVHTRDPCLWAAVAQLVHPLPPDLHDHDLPLSHPALPLLQKIPDSPDFSLITLLSLPNCIHLRDGDITNLRTLHRLLALDLRGCSISSYALTTLARGLAPSLFDDPTRSGPRGLRLLSLHGCPNVDDDALSALPRFPLLSVADLRFTRCTPTAVNARLSSLGFCPSGTKSLFHPAPLSLALCTLEKVALAASDPVLLYSCPPQSVFRVHINELNHRSSHIKMIVPVANPSTSRSTIWTVSSAEDTMTFIPSLRKQNRSESFPPPTSFVSSTALTSSPIDTHTHPSVSAFYGDAPACNRHPRTDILPLSAQAVHPSEGGKLDPLAIARSPPPWKVLDACGSPALSNPPVTVTCRRSAPGNVDKSQRTLPTARWIGQALNSPLEVDRARLHKRGSDAVADMVHQFTSKRHKVESEFALAKTRGKVFVKSRNPFASAKSVFASSSTNTSDKSRSPQEPPNEAEPDVQLRACRSLPSVRPQGTGVEGTLKPLKPITTLKPPILPRKLLPSLPKHASKPRTDLKQARLTFSREV